MSATARALSDRPSFEAIYRELRGPIYGYCHSRLGTAHAAEDATQQVFTQALAKFHTCRDDSTRAWLFTIARNVTANLIRGWRPSSSFETVPDIPTSARSPEDAAVAADLTGRLVVGIDRLTKEQREVIHLRFSGVSLAETAAILRTSEGAVKQLQHRAVLRLRTSLGLDPHGKEVQHG